MKTSDRILGFLIGIDEPAGVVGQHVQTPGAQIHAEHRRKSGLEAVGLVEDHHIVSGEDAPARHEMEPIEVVVGDDDVGILCLVGGAFGKAHPALRTLGLARALHA